MGFLKKKIAGKLKNKLKLYDKITPEMDEWRIVEGLQQKGIFPRGLREVYVYNIARQYERNVLEMEGVRVVSVELVKSFFIFMPIRYREIILRNRYHNLDKRRLHVYLPSHESLRDLPVERL